MPSGRSWTTTIEPWEYPAAAITSFAKDFELNSSRRGRVSAEQDPGRAQAISQTQRKWVLGTDHDQIDLVALRGGDHPVEVIGEYRQVHCHGFRAAVAGAQNSAETFGLCASFQSRACSRPPPPTTRIRIRVPPSGRSASMVKMIRGLVIHARDPNAPAWTPSVAGPVRLGSALASSGSTPSRAGRITSYGTTLSSLASRLHLSREWSASGSYYEAAVRVVSRAAGSWIWRTFRDEGLVRTLVPLSVESSRGGFRSRTVVAASGWCRD